MPSVRSRTFLAACPAVMVLGALIGACSEPKPAPAPPAPHAQELWGDMKPVVSVKELMRDLIDPASDYVFDAVKIVTTHKGTVETLPKTDEDWARIQAGAVTMAEGVYLLKVPRPFAPDGDINNSTGPDPEELSPSQIKAKLDKDPVLWNAKIEALRNVGLEVMELVKKKDVNGLWQASDDLDAACENCHVAFWYPGEGKLLKGLDDKLETLYGNQVLHPTRTGR